MFSGTLAFRACDGDTTLAGKADGHTCVLRQRRQRRCLATSPTAWTFSRNGTRLRRTWRTWWRNSAPALQRKNPMDATSRWRTHIVLIYALHALNILKHPSD